jgi:tetratricopeptide (TPR) repeat protein
MTALPEFDSLWDYNQPAETEARFRERLPVAREAGDKAYLAELLTQIARAQGLQRRFDDAHHTLDEAESLLSADMARPRIRYLLERGRVFNSSGKKELARPLFLLAWETARAAGEDAYAADAAHMMGIVEPAEHQLEWNLKALELAESSDDPQTQRWRGPLYNNIGWTYHDLGQYEDALAMFRRSVAWRESRGERREAQIARWTVARALRSLGRVAEALDMQRALQAELASDGVNDGYVPEEIGECLLLFGQPDAARPYFADAYAQLSGDDWLVANEAARLERLKQLGQVTGE